jgi:hypothetical protein
VTLRYDLPDPPGAGVSEDLAAHAVGVITSQKIPGLTAVGYGPEILVDPVADALRAAARQAGLDLFDILRVENGRYWSYRCHWGRTRRSSGSVRVTGISVGGNPAR